ncbi:GNAT family N-acetyltransferase [Halalkalibacillus sediminis]|uniref:GNAT family N-acetyltransferase n=1 Tax=Halalkalibacillus sediminis TaxID=2018042 RepID=A0A2I0QQZ1_9BACI|nr:GNAT family N-acetyltransferase [Halalkalibacillus sediminis]PKR76743.1 GNAT family N-acetyltransferase [Halalkalibacillus sediminis]
MEFTPTKDFELIARLNEYVHGLHHSLFPERFQPYNYEKFQVFFEEMVDKENHYFFKGVDGDEAFGYVWLEVKEQSESIFKKRYSCVYVHQISLKKNKEGRGYGTFLMDQVINFTAERKIKFIELDYWIKNDRARMFYEKHGFVRTREIVCKEL